MTSTAEMKLSPVIIEMVAQRLGVHPESIRVSQLTGDASTRVYYRAASDASSLIVTLYGEPFAESEGASARLARLEAKSPANRLTFANDPCAHIEVTELLLGAGLPVPRILATDGAERAILLEDVGDDRLQEWLAGQPQGRSTEIYRTAVELIVQIQEATELALTTNSICSRLAFDEMKLKWELGFFFANYFNRYLGLRLDGATANAVQEDFKAICAELSSAPRVLVHRDYHTRNLMMRGGTIVIIDHQDARMGPASYDPASLLNDPYIALQKEAADDLLEYFIELKARSRMPLPSVEAFRGEYKLMTVQRMLKAIGTYSSQAAVMNNPVYLPYIEPAISSAIEAMAAVGRFERTRALLEQTRQLGPNL